MPGSSLECIQLMLLSLRLLPSFFIICFGSVVLLFRIHIGVSKTKFDEMAQLLSKDEIIIKGIDITKTLNWTIIGLIYFLLAVAVFPMLIVLLQLSGVERPAFLMKFYPNYQSQKLKRHTATNDTGSIIYTVGSVSFVVSLALGLCICLTSRREITKAPKNNLAQNIRLAMLTYKLEPWDGVNKTRLLDKIQTSFKCCGLNSYYDYVQEPRKKGVSWEQHLYNRGFAASAGSFKTGERLLVKPPPMSCCLLDDTSALLNCTDSFMSHVGSSIVGSEAGSASSSIIKLHSTGCYSRLLQYMKYRQSEAEHWSFVIGACVAAMGTMAFWAQAM